MLDYDNIIQFIKYALAGGLATITHILVFHLITNVLWVFEAGRHPFIIEISLFYVVSGISIVIGTLLMGFLIKRFGMLTTYAFATNIISAVMINYAVRKFFIFQG